MRKYVGAGTYLVGLAAALCAGAVLSGALSRASAEPSLGWQVVHQSVPRKSHEPATVVVNCPARKHVLGGGAVILKLAGGKGGMLEGLDAKGILMESRPTDNYDSWRATGVDRTGYFEVDAYAICANV